MIFSGLMTPERTHEIPGPRGRFLRGSLGEFQENPLQLLVHSARKYGDIVRLRIGPRDFYLVSNPDYIQDILITCQRNFHKVQAVRLPQFLGNGLLRSEGDFHLRQRRLAQPAFHRQRIHSYGETMITETQRRMEKWTDGQTLDMHEEMMRLTLLIAAQTLFGADLEKRAEEVGEALTEALYWLNNRLGSPLALLPESFPTPANKRFQKAAAVLDKVVYDIIAERRASGEDTGDLLSMLLMAQDEEGGTGSMTDRQLRDEVMTLLMAGHETTANTLSWTWYLLSTHPEIREKLRAELDMVLDGRCPTAGDLRHLVYTGMIINESMRLYPPAWTQARQLTSDWEVGDHCIPVGSVVLFSQYVMHRHPDFWDNPEGFNPERFNPAVPDNRPRFSYFPFGAGIRQCIGQQFAMMETTLILATIAQQFQLDLLPGYPVEPHPLITLRPKHGMPMIVKKQSS